MSHSSSSQPVRSSMSRQTNRYIREVLHAPEPPPPIAVRYFYTSPLAIDDPLSPLPPPLTGSSASPKQPPRPFSQYDNDSLDRAWLDLRRKILKFNEEGGEKRPTEDVETAAAKTPVVGRACGKRNPPTPEARRRGTAVSKRRETISGKALQGGSSFEELPNGSIGGSRTWADSPTTLAGSLRAFEASDITIETDTPTTTGTPFIRAPSRTRLAPFKGPSPAPPRTLQREDSYEWDEEQDAKEASRRRRESLKPPASDDSGLSARVPVGVSRLHNVVIPGLKMEPIYWSPLNDIAPITRGTWFYKDSMLPVEVEVANMLEAGYVELQPWTETWNDELNSAVEVGALGEMKVLHRLWPEKPKRLESRPGTSRGDAALRQGTLEDAPITPEKEREATLENAGDRIDISTGPQGPDNKAAGSSAYGRDGNKRLYVTAGIIYANKREAYILRPSLQPSAYYGRRPLANSIRKGRRIGIPVVRGFDQEAWDRLYPPKKSAAIAKAYRGVSTSQGGIPPSLRLKSDLTIAHSERPLVTDLVLVIHGIGQKLSERIESFHFTHAINAFRREVNVELGTESVKAHLRKDMGGIMVLPVNWRLSLSFEDGGYRSDEEENPAVNNYGLNDITPDTLTSVRNIISDVMLDVPYYLSQEHNPKMIAACIAEANRIYRLWCTNNPGFAEYGRVHLLAHSLGSVMAIDILSHQPTHVPPYYGNPSVPEREIPTDHFIFDTKSLFVCGSPVGFFLLLKRAQLMPRRDRNKPGADSNNSPGVAGDQGTYGCIAVDNIYNIVNPYDPVAYRLNATVDSAYAAALKPAFVPSAAQSWFSLSSPFRHPMSSAETAMGMKPGMPRLPSNVELETHNFTREEIAEKRAYLLNDNGQIDYFLKYGGGPFEIQYLTMLGAHSSYWISRDFVRMVVMEVGRRFGKDGTVLAMRAQKKKKQIS